MATDSHAELQAELSDIDRMFVELTAAVGMDMRDELLALFFPTLDECVAGLVAAIPAAETTVIIGFAHKLKGAAAQLGASRLAAYSRAIEVAAKNADMAEAAQQFELTQALGVALAARLRVA